MVKTNTMNIEKHCYQKGYRITKEGSIMNPKGETLGGVIPSNGRIHISCRVNNVHKLCSVHRLQAYQKYKDDIYNAGIEVRHLNGNCLDNSYNNIELGSHSENMMDIPREIRIKKALHATSFVRKYNKDEVKLWHTTNNNSYKATMRKFNISSKGTLHYILNH